MSLLTFPWNPIADRGAIPLFAVVERAWSAPGRAYHSVEHLTELLHRCREVDADVGWASPVDVFLASLFHDAIYEPLRADNEVRSAALASEQIAAEPSLRDASLARVVQWIEATARHGAHPPRSVDDDEGMFLDADMAILGADEDRYRRYVVDVRTEYAAVPEEAFIRGRRSFVRGVLASPAVFVSPYFRARFEDVSRDNLARELDWLEGGQRPPWEVA